MACCDMQYENETAYTLLSENLDAIMVDNNVPSVNVKDFMADKVKQFEMI